MSFINDIAKSGALGAPGLYASRPGFRKGVNKVGKNIGRELFGTSDKIKRAKTLTPDQEELMALITEGLTSGEGPFGQLFGAFNQEDFDKGVTQPALKNFQENILPQIQEKFIAGNQVLGSGMRRGQLKAATDLQDNLAQLMYQAQQGQKQNQLAGLQTGLGTRAFENIYKQGKPGLLSQFLGGAAKGAGQIASSAMVG